MPDDPCATAAATKGRVYRLLRDWHFFWGFVLGMAVTMAACLLAVAHGT